MGNIKGSKRGKYNITSPNKGWFKTQGKLKEKKCLYCGKVFKKYRSNFCSHACFTKNNIGKKRPKHSLLLQKEVLGYSGVHTWIEREFEKHKVCDNCKENPGKAKDGRNLIHWANKDGRYLKKRENWLCLCQSCHSKYDKSWLDKKIIRDKKGRIKGIICIK